MKSEKLLKINEYLAGRGVSISEDDRGLFLAYKDMILRADFTEMLGRIAPGALAQELIVKASGINKRNPRFSPLAIDATAGLGEDSLLLAASGYRVLMYEKDPVTFCLLEDAINRALSLPDEPEYKALKEAAARMEAYNEDSIDSMTKMVDSGINPDIVFLDPMFPERKKELFGRKKVTDPSSLGEPMRKRR